MQRKAIMHGKLSLGLQGQQPLVTYLITNHVDNRNEHNRYIIGLGEIGKSIGDFNTNVTTLKTYNWGVNETLGNDLGDICDYIGVFTRWGTMGIVVGLHVKIIKAHFRQGSNFLGTNLD
jgi:hypothetical protein